MTSAPVVVEFQVAANGQRLSAAKVLPDAGSKPSVLNLHGYGVTANRHTVRYLLDELAEDGYGSICFDFSGNGDSTGLLDEASLSGRHAELMAVAAELDTAVPPIVIGTSMGAHLAACASPELRPRGLILFCPAAYPTEAADRLFGQGLLRAGSASPAFAGISQFDGDLLIVAARQDQVVPPQIATSYFEHAVSARSRSMLWIEDCDHFIHRAVPHRPADRARIMAAVRDLLTTEMQF